jgi:STE24 endopeptidase
MRSKTEFQHTFFALGLVILAGLAADLVLWPRDELPAVLTFPASDYFGPTFMAKAQSFRGLQSWLGVASMLLLIVVPLAIALSWPKGMAQFGDKPGKGRVLGCASVGAVITAVTLLATFPFALIAFVRSRHFGLSVQSVGGWFFDWLLGAALTVGAVALLALVAGALIRRFGRAWWPLFGIMLIALAAIFQMLSPVLIEPLFADYKVLPAGQTRDQVESLAKSAGVHAGQIYVVDAAKRTSGANAYVTGLGSTKRVVLYDTLFRDFNHSERRQVIAHELGHAHYSDLTTGLLWFSFVAMVSLFAVDLLARVLAARREVTMDMPAAIAMIAAAAMIAIALTQPAANALSRKVEARADAFALQVTADPDAAILLEQRLTMSNIARPEPPAVRQLIFGTHPTPMERIGMAKQVKRELGR